jgi:hypothetical protein
MYPNLTNLDTLGFQFCWALSVRVYVYGWHPLASTQEDGSSIMSDALDSIGLVVL